MPTEFTVYKPVIKDLRFETEEHLEPNDESYIFFTVENKNPDLTISTGTFYFTISYISETKDFLGKIIKAPIQGTYASGAGKFRRNSSALTYDEDISGIYSIKIKPLESVDFRYELQTEDRHGNQLSYPTNAELDVTCTWFINIESLTDEEILQKKAFKISKD